MCWGIGDWGLGIGDWGSGIGPNLQSPIPNPQSPIPNPPSFEEFLYTSILTYFNLSSIIFFTFPIEIIL